MLRKSRSDLVRYSLNFTVVKPPIDNCILLLSTLIPSHPSEPLAHHHCHPQHLNLHSLPTQTLAQWSCLVSICGGHRGWWWGDWQGGCREWASCHYIFLLPSSLFLFKETSVTICTLFLPFLTLTPYSTMTHTLTHFSHDRVLYLTITSLWLIVPLSQKCIYRPRYSL